jgi:hypothetical protein
MPEPLSPATRVRAAADALKAAVDRHLAAVEARAGEADPAVFAAFDELAAAADAYDELLYETYDEVTPFEIPDHGTEQLDEAEAEPGSISVLMRRDYQVVDPRAVVEAARTAERDGTMERADAEDRGLGEADTRAVEGREALEFDVRDVGGAIAALFDTFDPEEIQDRCEEIGLEPGDSTIWVLASHESEPGEWLEDPFSEADADRLLYRLDVVTEEEDGEGDDDLDGIEVV